MERPPIGGIGTSAALALALLLALGGLARLLDAGSWWLVCAMTVLVVLGAVVAVRHVARRLVLPSVAGSAALIGVVTLLFAADTAVLGVIPTPGSLARFGQLLSEGTASIQEQGVPATAVPGILFILAASSGAVTILADAVVTIGRSPALTGIPLLAVVAAPGLIDPEYTDPLSFVLTAAAWLLVLFVASPRVQPGVASGIAAGAVVAALVVPLVLPPVLPIDDARGGEGYTTGLNPIVELGDDLRRDAPVVALTYTTTSEERQYLRMATLEEFEDTAWAPVMSSVDTLPDPESISADPERSPDVAVVESTTEIAVGNVRGRWLPLPYAPRSVTGLVGTWTWDPENLNVRTVRSSVRGQEYSVTTETAAPTSDQLRAADPVAAPELERYLGVPDSLPPLVAETAAAVTAEAPTNYDKAVALQRYFRGGDFVYSEEAPVDDDYDGTSATVIGRFLEEKSGYCVHFASAMAAMARTLDIPARIAVGFTTGSEVGDSTGEESEFRVTTDDLHAWPELHFAGVGWVRFEPTVGRTNVPEYVDAAQDDPATPDIDESTATAAPTDAAPEVEADRLDSGDVSTGPADRALDPETIMLSLAALVLLAALAVPAATRVARRRSRLRDTAGRGSAIGAWHEVRDTALDLGWRLTDADTPRQFTDRLTTPGAGFSESGPIGGRPLTDLEAVAALDRLRAAVELESFARAGAGSAGGPQSDPARGWVGTAGRDARLVVAALRDGVSRGVRVRAALAPASILVRWFTLGARRRASE